jgi:hypothetical protein
LHQLEFSDAKKKSLYFEAKLQDKKEFKFNAT